MILDPLHVEASVDAWASGQRSEAFNVTAAGENVSDAAANDAGFATAVTSNVRKAAL